MLDRNYRDIVAGGLISALGIAISLYAFAHLEMGVARRMGPGMVPFWLGIVLLVCGAIIFANGYRSEGSPLRVRLREPLFVILAVGTFALIVPHLGVIPAVFVLVAVSMLAEGKLQPVRMLLLATGLSVFCFVVFDLMLRLTLPMFDWRF